MTERNIKNNGKNKNAGPDRHRVRITMPVSRVKQGSLLSFRDMADLKEKYFTMKGCLDRKPCAARMSMLLFCQFVMTAILAGRVIEALLVQQPVYVGLFGGLLLLFNIPFVWSEFSLGVRRLHDLGKPGFWFVIPVAFYAASFITTAWGYNMAATIVQSITAVLFLALFSIKGREGEGTYGRRRDR